MCVVQPTLPVRIITMEGEGMLFMCMLFAVMYHALYKKPSDFPVPSRMYGEIVKFFFTVWVIDFSMNCP
jgi:hypothetical protein